MQTTQNNILSFDASIQGGVKKQNAQKQKQDRSEDGGEFLSMVLNAAAKKEGGITEKDIKDIASAVNMSSQKKEPFVSEPKAIDVKEILGEEAAGNLFENATFMQLLQILEMLNGGDKISKYPNFSSQLAKALSNETTLNELRGAKSLTELIDIANKLNLGLENISVTQEQADELSAKFPNLAKDGFFTPITPKNIVSDSELKAKVEENIQTAQKNEPQVALNKLLQDVGEGVKTKATDESKNVEKIAKAMTDEVASGMKQEMPKEENKQSKSEVKTEAKEEKKINLQSLLYPEREQGFNEKTATQSGEGDSQESDNALNAMVKDVISNARSQAKNLQAVRETFSNFNATLKEQIEAYKSPFMRFNITLNPLNLGEVEITMVNRGNNLHINFSSSTQTMNLFLQNQAEFKNSLVNMGFTELEMNFSDQNQQKKEQGQKSYKNNSKFDLDDDITMPAPSLELVIPRYV